MSRRFRLIAPLMALLVAVTACGDPGETDEERSAVVQMIERLGQPSTVADCMADEFDGTITVDQLQTMVDARGDFSTVDFALLQTFTSAQTKCEAGDG